MYTHVNALVLGSFLAKNMTSHPVSERAFTRVGWVKEGAWTPIGMRHRGAQAQYEQAHHYLSTTPSVEEAEAFFTSCSHLPTDVQTALQSFVLIPLFLSLIESGELDTISFASFRLPKPANPYLSLFRIWDWIYEDDTLIEFQVDGLLALEYNRVYQFIASYMPYLRSIDTPETAAVDRMRDLTCSSEIFTAELANTFYSYLTTIFSQQTPPKGIVDIGCGNGNMLALCGAFLEQEFGISIPLFGIDPDPVALAEASKHPNIIALEGSINDPEALDNTLTEYGFRLSELLPICKSVWHDREYVPPTQPITHLTTDAIAYASEQLESGNILGSLAELFLKWKPYTKSFGFAFIEAFAAPKSTPFALYNPQLTVEAMHSLSGQILIEKGPFTTLLQACGYTILFADTHNRLISFYVQPTEGTQ